MVRGPLAYAHARPRFVAELKDFIRFPSVSTQPRHAADLEDCAAWLADNLQRVGLENQDRAYETSSHRLCRIAASARKANGLDLRPLRRAVNRPAWRWRSPPFEPLLRGEDLYGREASDDKGQLFVHVKAVECYLRTTGKLPLNVRCLFEGEEEIGSPSLPSFLERHRDLLAADIAVLSDTRIVARIDQQLPMRYARCPIPMRQVELKPL